MYLQLSNVKNVFLSYVFSPLSLSGTISFILFYFIFLSLFPFYFRKNATFSLIKRYLHTSYIFLPKTHPTFLAEMFPLLFLVGVITYIN